MSSIRILLADDHGVVRKGLRFLLSQDAAIEIVAEAEDGREALRLATEWQPNIVIMDIAMPQLNGLDAAAQICKTSPRTAVIMLSMYSDEEFLIRALGAGAKGYLLKDSAEADVLRAVHAVAQGRTYFSPAIAHTLLEDYMRRLSQEGLQDRYDLLTDREREVLQLLAEGRSNKDVAALLNLSVHTVDSHRTNFMQKLGLHNTAEIVIYAMRKKIIS
ncbi:MAG TPA: response regulator transcription factor [Bryobacteraceae bacterium]|nr:response regulator transcription factor [Bryobacteraceae bacterium]